MTDHPCDLSTLLLLYKLSAGVCREQVSDVHLEQISRSHCKDWRKLPPHLELEDIIVSDIDRKQVIVSEDEKRQEFFFSWKRRKGSGATYEHLIGALLMIECRQDAESICKLLQAPISRGGQESCSFESVHKSCGATPITAGMKTQIVECETCGKGLGRCSYVPNRPARC